MYIIEAVLLLCLGSTATAAIARDNCYRALAGKSSSASAACSSFFQQPKVTPCTSTSTVTLFTTTVYVSPTPGNKRAVEQPDLVARDATITTCGVATGVPTYASFCSGASRFSSACNANGVTGTIAVTAAPVTSISTSSAAATSTLNACTQRTLNIQIIGGVYANQYLSGGMFLARGGSDPSSATTFTLNQKGELSYLGSSNTYYIQKAYDPASSGSFIVNGPTPGNDPSSYTNSWVTPKCSVSSSSVFTCTADNSGIPGFSDSFFGSNQYSGLVFGNAAYTGSGAPLNLVASNVQCTS